jgi:hypothetical protein
MSPTCRSCGAEWPTRETVSNEAALMGAYGVGEAMALAPSTTSGPPRPFRSAAWFVFEPVRVIDGAGWAPPVGRSVALGVFNDHFEVGPASLPLASVSDVRVEGHSLVKGGGFFGGGFGAVGAIEGMAAASVLNALSTKRKAWVSIAIAAADGWVSLRYDRGDETKVRIALRGLAGAAFHNRTLARPPAPEVAEDGPKDLVTQLERLTKLHEAGALSDEEFGLAKSRLLF